MSSYPCCGVTWRSTQQSRWCRAASLPPRSSPHRRLRNIFGICPRPSFPPPLAKGHRCPETKGLLPRGACPSTYLTSRPYTSPLRLAPSLLLHTPGSKHRRSPGVQQQLCCRCPHRPAIAKPAMSAPASCGKPPLPSVGVWCCWLLCTGVQPRRSTLEPLIGDHPATIHAYCSVLCAACSTMRRRQSGALLVA